MTKFKNVFRQHCRAASGVVLATVVVYILILLLSPADKSSVANYIGTRVKPSLQLTVVVTRHGNRSPSSGFPGFPYPVNDTKYWLYGYNELTPKGRIQMFDIGKKIRAMYSGFLDQFYFPKEFIAYSTPRTWTLESGEIFLAGLFPPKGFQEWNKNILWQPIPVFENTNDHTWYPTEIGNTVECPRFGNAEHISYLEFLKTDAGRDMVSMMTELAPYTGLTIANSYYFYVLWMCIFIADVEGYPVPEWAKKYYPEPMTSIITNLLTFIAIGSEIQIRLLEGPLFKDIVVDLFQSKINGTNPAQKMYYLSGHDFSILGIEAILGLSDYDENIVNPGSALILELHRNSDSRRYYVEVLFIDGLAPDLEPVTCHIPGCEAPCDWYSLANMTAKYYNITNLEKECEVIQDL